MGHKHFRNNTGLQYTTSNTTSTNEDSILPKNECRIIKFNKSRNGQYVAKRDNSKSATLSK